MPIGFRRRGIFWSNWKIFSKAIDDLENIDVKIDDEDKAILLLNALPKVYDQKRDAILFGREGTVTLQQVQSALRSKELQRSADPVNGPTPESFSIKKFKAKKGSRRTMKPSNLVAVSRRKLGLAIGAKNLAI